MHQSTRRATKAAKTGQIRIIGGRWKGRRIKFTHATGLRPTLDRVRETLFNWLMHDIQDARCLDLFAGSAALGIEALSRGAGEVVFVEKNNKVVVNIHRAIADLEFKNTTILNTSAEVVFKKNDTPYDIIFVDPPFYQDYLTETLKSLNNSRFLKEDSLVYVEKEKHADPIVFPENWQIKKSQQVGALEFYLFEINGLEDS